MVFRKLGEGDVAAYLEMATDFYNSPAVLHSIPQNYIENTVKAVLSGTPFADIYVFEENGAAIGYGLLAYTYSQEAGGTVCWLEEIYVRPEARGAGVGAAFIEFVKETVFAARYRLEVEPDNTRVKALYRRHGFSPLAYESYVLENREENGKKQ
ncbi:MAG: GNAT family N-acetyltransferase [Ruminococcaceae bacterium]|nr:GNAT family N-acetyltransferase [Oscillospiraceae bacterium]